MLIKTVVDEIPKQFLMPLREGRGSEKVHHDWIMSNCYVVARYPFDAQRCAALLRTLRVRRTVDG